MSIAETFGDKAYIIASRFKEICLDGVAK